MELGVCGFILVLEAGMGISRGLCFLTQSVETIENKRVEFFVSAKKRRGVRKSVKGKGLVTGEW
jgi:hypothetical protein